MQIKVFDVLGKTLGDIKAQNAIVRFKLVNSNNFRKAFQKKKKKKTYT